MEKPVLSILQHNELRNSVDDVIDASSECQNAQMDIHNEASNDIENMLLNLDTLFDAAERAQDEADTLLQRVSSIREELRMRLDAKQDLVKMRYDGVSCVLVDAESEPVDVTMTHKDFRGEEYRITGGEAPQTPASTGKVYCSALDAEVGDPENVFYASVFGMRWQEV